MPLNISGYICGMGKSMGNISTMEDRGRVLIPKEFREGIKAGQKLLIEKREKEIELHGTRSLHAQDAQKNQ